MTSVPELAAKLNSNQALVDDVAGSVEKSRQDVGKLLWRFHRLGAGEGETGRSCNGPKSNWVRFGTACSVAWPEPLRTPAASWSRLRGTSPCDRWAVV